MARRQRKKDDEVALREPARIAEQPYTVGEWSGQPQYRCRYCDFDAMRLEAMLEHVKKAHFPEPSTMQENKAGHGIEMAASQSGRTRLIGVYEIDLEEVLSDGTSSIDENNG